MARSVNAYVLGEHIGSSWGLGHVMRWTPAAKPSRIVEAGQSPAVLKSVGLYKGQGDAVAAVIGGIFNQFVSIHILLVTLASFNVYQTGWISCAACVLHKGVTTDCEERWRNCTT